MKIMSLSLLLTVVLGLARAPSTAWSLLAPPSTPSAWPSKPECCSTNGVLSARLWSAPFLKRQSTCRPAMKAPAPEETREHGTPAREPWGAGAKYLSAWVAGAASTSRSLLHASSPQGLGALWQGGSGGEGGNNGTGNGVPGGDAMEGEGDGDKAADLNVCYDYDPRKPPADYGAVPPKSSKFGPWVWLSALWGFYALWLKRSPIVTKALTSGCLALGGDLAAQWFEAQQKEHSGLAVKDKRRLLAVAIDSVLITGPALHALYGLLERFIPTTAGGFVPAVSHLLVDTFVFDPMFVVSFFCVTGVLENRPLRLDVLPALRREFWPAVHGSWVVSFVFCPLQYVTFRYLPLEFRVLSVNVCDIVWTSVLSYFSHKKAPAAEVGAGAANRGVL